MRLHQDLINESIQIIGLDCIYLPARRHNFDKLYGASDITTYDTAYTIEVYLETYAGFAGDQSFMTNLDLRFETKSYLTVSMKASRGNRNTRRISRPREADLMYFPLIKVLPYFTWITKACFLSIRHISAFKLTCELFEASSERFTTGIPGIDRLNKSSQDMYGWSYTDVNGVPYIDEAGNVCLIDAYAVTTLTIRRITRN